MQSKINIKQLILIIVLLRQNLFCMWDGYSTGEQCYENDLRNNIEFQMFKVAQQYSLNENEFLLFIKRYNELHKPSYSTKYLSELAFLVKIEGSLSVIDRQLFQKLSMNYLGAEKNLFKYKIV